MARPATNLDARLRELGKSFDRARHVPCGQVVQSVEMSKILGVNWTTLRGWCRDIEGFADSGVFEAGDKGINYTFEPRATIFWLMRHFEARRAASHKASRGVADAAGVKLPESEMPSVAETKDLVNLTLAVVDATEKQKRYMLVEEGAAFLDGYNRSVVNAILGVRTQVDPNGNLPPDVRLEMDDYLRSVANAAHASAEQFIEECRAGLQQGGTG